MLEDVWALLDGLPLESYLLLLKSYSLADMLDILKQPKIDENHPTWLHLQIREFDPTFDEKKSRSHRINATNHEEDGKWTLGFTNAKACDAARLLILEETNKQRSSVESLLAPLLNISQHITNCLGD